MSADTAVALKFEYPDADFDTAEHHIAGFSITRWSSVAHPTTPDAAEITTAEANYAAAKPALEAAREINSLKSVKAAVLYAAERAGDDITSAPVRTAAFERAQAIFQLL